MAVCIGREWDELHLREYEAALATPAARVVPTDDRRAWQAQYWDDRVGRWVTFSGPIDLWAACHVLREYV